MKIAIMGAGGIGAFYGACLARSGNDVAFVARGAHLDAIRENGLKIASFDGADFSICPANATDDPKDIGPVDVVLFCVKMYDTTEAAHLCKPLMGENTMVVTLQNGVESVAMIDAVLGTGRTLGGSAFVSATIKEPGIISRNNHITKIEFGEMDGAISPRAQEFAKCLEDAAIEVVLSRSIQSTLWTKFVLVTSNSALASISRSDTGVIREDPVMRAAYIAAMDETIAVGQALGVQFPDDVVERTLTWLDSSASITPSLALDLKRGRRLEVEWLSGALHRLGAKVGVPTPIHSTVYAALRPYIGGTR